MVIINSFKYPDSNIRHEQRNVRAIIDSKDMGVGTLFISESTLCWQQTGDAGFTIGYTDISLHAISRDANLYPEECLYIVTDKKVLSPEDDDPDIEDGDHSDVDDAEVSELILVPDETNPSAITTFYEAIKICQELNPDPEDVDEEDDNLYADAEDEMVDEQYYMQERGGGDADVDNLAQRMQANSVDVCYSQTNGNNEDDEFQDAD
ncbi:methylosome subunit pICln-like [Cylas formicarius]|uniref:methylosome subunit pICln-like n=1 Tax=Cylas formicarius TaxID=197179 RepID=UPI0029589D0B|nr:methylosome subunit pICln-like [Cylas formicarius]